MGRFVLERLEVDQVLFCPVFLPCHKDRPQVSYEDRCAMVECLIESEEHFSLSRIDCELGGTTYTYRTLESLLEGDYFGHDMYFMMGADSMEEFSTWRQWRRILELARPVVLARPGHRLRAPGVSEKLLSRFIILRGFKSRCSSTAIRKELARSRASRCLTRAVRDYVRSHRLYFSSTISK